MMHLKIALRIGTKTLVPICEITILWRNCQQCIRFLKYRRATLPLPAPFMSAAMGEWPFEFPLEQPKGSYDKEALEKVMRKTPALWPKLNKTSAHTALATDFSAGDVGRAITLLQFWVDATRGYISRPQHLPLRGSCNYNGISCYADSLLMAMFSRMNNFEPLLYQQQFDSHATEVLAVWLRLFVNLLRNGELLTADIVRGLLEAAEKAGWHDLEHQQDAVEFFGFITEKLRMPLLNLKVNIAHGGREAAEDDHKSVLEQVLYLPVPGGSEDPPIPLEACLEEYFSNAVSVSRYLDPIQSPPQPQDLSQQAKRSRSYSIVSTTTPNLPYRRPTAVLENDELPSYSALYGVDSPALDVKRSLWTPENEMNLPAWMFLQLMPFYAENQGPSADNLEARQVAQHFKKSRPILGLCLKRYSWDMEGRATRNSRTVVVPENIHLPSFVADDSDQERVFGNFKLELESAIFHRGDSINSGHYVAVVGDSPRSNWRSLSRPGSQPTSPELTSQDTRERQWLLFDDMAPVGEKVKSKKFSEVFDAECPYFLFYRMVALDEPNPEPLTKPEHSKPKRKKMFFRRQHRNENYAEFYREEKCTLQ